MGEGQDVLGRFSVSERTKVVLELSNKRRSDFIPQEHGDTTWGFEFEQIDGNRKV